MSTERKIVSLACPFCGNEMIQDGKIRLKCDICGAVRGQALPDYSLMDVDPASIPKEVLEKAFPPIDYDKKPPFDKDVFDESVYEPANYIQSYMDNCMEKFITCEETECEFIFGHFTRYANGELFAGSQDIIPKRLLERALICFKEEHKEEWDVLMGVEKPYYGCIYCVKETGPDGLDGYKCWNKERRESWCLPMCSMDHDCSKCECRVTKEDVKNGKDS